jgi:GH25 family lysozyme M1 (1,4-beta-N-acetylmuramidase)
MIDLSNNNGLVDFGRLAREGHQRRVYLKRSEGTGFADRTFPGLRQRAHANGFKVGAYHFAHPQTNTPLEELRFLLELLPHLRRGPDLRTALDLEHGSGSAQVGRWALEFCRLHRRELGFVPVLYSYGSYLEACGFSSPPAPLWLAAYDRNDGREHPFRVPRPWRSLAAHQFASSARLPGASGAVDLSHVYDFAALELPHLLALRRLRRR